MTLYYGPDPEERGLVKGKELPLYRFRDDYIARLWSFAETVEWLVLKQVFQASPEQIFSINQIEGDNARRVQMLFGRRVDD